jgi:tetratricopeptide (TPR) repeat protein
LKVAPARLRYWKRTALAQADEPELRDTAKLSESLDPTRNPSVRPDFDFRDLVCVRAMLTLVDRGISVRRIRRAVAVLQENLPDLDDPLAALRLWSDGSERIVVQHQGVLIEPEGQMVLDFSGTGAAMGEPASIDERLGKQANQGPAKAPVEIYTELMTYFERGCGLDSDSATYEEAISAYEHCLELDPRFADAHCNLGAVLYNAGKSKPARRCFERCLEIDHGHVEAHFNLANLLEEVRCDEMALSHYRAALRSDPFYAELHVNMALLYQRLSATSSSLDHWRRYLQIDPTGAWAEVARERLGIKTPR